MTHVTFKVEVGLNSLSQDWLYSVCSRRMERLSKRAIEGASDRQTVNQDRQTDIGLGFARRL